MAKNKSEINISSNAAGAVKKLEKYPAYADGAKIRYTYVLPLTAYEGINVTDEILCGEERIVSPMPSGDKIILKANGREFGYVGDAKKAEMLSDWKQNGDPVKAVLLADGDHINLLFYKDLRKHAGNREQTVTPLTDYNGSAKQRTIRRLSAGDELELEEDYDHEGNVTVSYMGSAIGALPAEHFKKYMEHGAYAAFVESLEDEHDDNCGLICKPAIRIYWNN